MSEEKVEIAHKTVSELPSIEQPFQNNSNFVKNYSIETITLQSRKSFVALMDTKFYEKEGWWDEMCEILFKIKSRQTTIKSEIYFGLIHFISCLYVLAVIPNQLAMAGYDKNKTTVAIALCIGIGSIFSGLFANLPFVLAPPTVVSIFLSVFLQQYYDISTNASADGNIGVIISGFGLIFFGWRPLGSFVSHLIPLPIQVGTAVGIGLLTALTGSVDVKIVEQGDSNILKLGVITPEVVITFLGIIIICVASNYHIQGAFCLGLIICSIIWWGYSNSFPSSIAGVPYIDPINETKPDTNNLAILTIDLFFLYILYLNGIVDSLGRIASLTRDDDTVPRGTSIYIYN